MTSPAQPEPPNKTSSRLHLIFRHYDPEAAGVISIVLGIVQVLLALPVYSLKFLAFLYMIPLSIGILFIIGGSLTFACCKSSDARLLKGCVYSNLVCLFGALVAVCFYMTAICGGAKLPEYNCTGLDNTMDPGMDDYYNYKYLERSCNRGVSRIHNFYHAIVISLLVYDIAAMVLHSLLLYSAVKGLKID